MPVSQELSEVDGETIRARASMPLPVPGVHAGDILRATTNTKETWHVESGRVFSALQFDAVVVALTSRKQHVEYVEVY
jgi:hypothetical protein